MLQLLSLSLYGLVSEIMQKFEQKIIFINDDDALWIGDGKCVMVIRSLNSEVTQLFTRNRERFRVNNCVVPSCVQSQP